MFNNGTSRGMKQRSAFIALVVKAITRSLSTILKKLHPLASDSSEALTSVIRKTTDKIIRLSSSIALCG